MRGLQSLFLLLAFIGYLAIGGVIFKTLENGSVEYYTDLPVTTAQEIVEEKIAQWNISLYQNLTSEKMWMALQELKDLCFQEVNTTRQEYVREWDFYDAFIFSLTVVTTIGYGHLSPISRGGQIFCIFYSIVGIPMTGILIAAFGDIFSAVLLRAHERSKSERFNSTLALVVNTIFYLIPGMIVFLFLPAVVFASLEDWTYLESFYFAFITLTTIGFGDFVAGHEKEFDYRWIYQVGIMIWIVFGLGYWAMMLNFIIKAMKSKQIKRFNKTVTRGFRQTQRMFSKEMEEFMRSMNQYSTKIMPKSQHTKLKRTKSLPSIHKKQLVDSNGRCLSDSALLAHASTQDDDIYFVQQEAHANTMGFIFQLAKAFAYGDIGGENLSRSLRSLRSTSRHPSLLELLSDAVVQAQSRKNSLRDGNNFDTYQNFGRLHPTRRSCEISDFRSHGVLDLSSNGGLMRRRSDGGCYLDVPRSGGASVAPDISVLEEVNELEGQETTSSKDNLMSSTSTPSPKQRRNERKSPKKPPSQEIDELLKELRHKEQLWTPSEAGTNGKLYSGWNTSPKSLPSFGC